MRRPGIALLVGLSAAASAAAGESPWRAYTVYRPRVERRFVVNADEHPLRYNHDSSMARFGDRLFCLWNGNTTPAEGKPGQLNYVSTSPDGREWSDPEPAFSDPRRSVNPIPCPEGTQWQPNLIVVDGRLLAVWSQNSRDGHAGCYVSTLAHPDGRWENRRLTWEGNPDPVIDGKRFRVFPTQNPVRLRSGRLLAPVTLIGPPAADAPADVTGWWATEKRDSVLYSDDAGQTWGVSPGAVQPGRSWAQWEPTVWEVDDGRVMMFARNNDFRGRAEGGPGPAEMLTVSTSDDGGRTWTPHRHVPIETVASRMHVIPAGGNRFVMVHNDRPAGAFVQDRRNLALFFTRGPGVDFVAGPGISGDESVVAYPQMWPDGEDLLVCYSRGNNPRSIAVSRISPLPDPARYYVFPRSNTDPSPVPGREGDAFRFAGDQWLETTVPVDPGEAGLLVAFRLCPEGAGVLLDTRTFTPPAGFVIGLTEDGTIPFIHLGTAEGNIAPALRLDRGRTNTLAVGVETADRTVRFLVNGTEETIRLAAAPPNPLRGTTGRVGWKRQEASRLGGFTGTLEAMEVHGASGAREALSAFRKRHESAPDGKPEPGPVPAVLLDPAREPIANAWSLPAASPVGTADEVVDGRGVLRIRGPASAGLDLDPNRRDRDTVEVAFEARTFGTADAVLCTVGDATRPVRVVAVGGRILLRGPTDSVDAGPAAPGEWVRIGLMTGSGRTGVAVNGGPAVSTGHAPEATWIYLGDGYPPAGEPSASDFAVDMRSLRSRVIPGTRPAGD